MKNSRKLLQATAISVVLGFGLHSNGAWAFDNVNWNWEKNVNEQVNKTANINVDLNPSGELELEKIQAQIGDVTANSTVTGVHNNPPAQSDDGTVHISTHIDLNAPFDDNAAGNPVSGVNITSGDGLSASNGSGNVDNNLNTIFLHYDLAGDVKVDPSQSAALDAIDLPKVASAATAVGNNQNIDSSSSIQLHDGQFLFGGYSQTSENNIPAIGAVINGTPDTGNSNTTAAAGLTLAGALGLITPASVTANSTVSDILNASVDSTATAVGNNMNITLAAVTRDDALAIADVTQYSYANVNATSSVSDVNVNNYTNFGGANMGPLGNPQIPLVNSAATAVGNNFAIKVSAPSVQ